MSLPEPVFSSLVGVQVDVNHVHKISHTDKFDGDELRDVVITRRGTTFPIWLKSFRTAIVSDVNSATLIYEKDRSKRVTLEIVQPVLQSGGTATVDVSELFIQFVQFDFNAGNNNCK